MAGAAGAQARGNSAGTASGPASAPARSDVAGAAPMRGRTRVDRPGLAWGLALGAVWAIAFALRAWVAQGAAYGDETAHFFVARSWGEAPANVYPPHELYASIWWQRPLFSILLWPGAALGFEAYRLWHAAIASLLPVAVAALVWRAVGAARPMQPDLARPTVGETVGQARAAPALLRDPAFLAAAGAALAVAVHPTFVLWGSRVFPDSLMAVLAVAGVERFLARRWLASAALLLAATWVKEVAVVLLAALFAWSCVRAVRSREASLYPLRADKPMTALGAAGLLAPMPLLVAMVAFDGRLPGWSTSPLAPAHADALAVSAWVGALALSGLAWRTSRPLAAAALALPAFYLVYGLLGRGIESWYAVASAALVVAAACAALVPLRQRRPAAARAAAVLLAAVVAVAALVPAGSVAHDATTPFDPHAAPLADLGAAAASPGDLEQAVAELAGEDWNVTFVVDLGWFHLAYPFAQHAKAVGWAYTDIQVPMSEWAAAMEHSNVTVLLKVERPMNQALRDVYADCVAHDNGSYTVFRAGACPGRAEALRVAYEARGGRAFGQTP